MRQGETYLLYKGMYSINNKKIIKMNNKVNEVYAVVYCGETLGLIDTTKKRIHWEGGLKVFLNVILNSQKNLWIKEIQSYSPQKWWLNKNKYSSEFFTSDTKQMLTYKVPTKRHTAHFTSNGKVKLPINRIWIDYQEVSTIISFLGDNFWKYLPESKCQIIAAESIIKIVDCINLSEEFTKQGRAI